MPLATATHLKRQHDRQAVERALHAREARRSRGVSIAGMSPFDFTPVGARDLLAAAEASALREAEFKASPEGELVSAICAARTALRDALMQLEAVDSARLRGDGSVMQAADKLLLATSPLRGAALDVSLAAEAA